MITFTNVLMRVVFYLVESVIMGGTADDGSYFTSEDWIFYLMIVLCSNGGVVVGGQLFKLLKDSKETTRMILAILLVICGISLVISSFGGL